MSPIDLPKIYNPAIQTKQELIDNFVVRTELFKDILADIKTSEMKHPEQHYIVQGSRGQGKTTLLLRIAYEIQNDRKLSKRLIPVIFNEEQYNITRLFKLWEAIAEYLKDSGEMPGLYDQMQHLDYDDDYEHRCFELLERALIANHKKIIIFIDNIDELFEKFSKQEHHRLREVFIESAEIRVIGASSISLEFHHDYGKPLYQFFKMPYLKGLNVDETKTLLLGLGKHYKKDRVKDIVDNQPGRIEALRRLTGGVIRTIIILFEIFVDDENGNAFKDLEKILDSVTPLYKHRMDKLSAQQQEIVDFIALNWDAVSVKEIARKTKLESKAVSAQLKQLEKYSIIEKEKTNTKNYLYRIYERFFNIWYLMRLGRKWDERRVRFVVEFLQIWCDEKELETRASRHLSVLKQGKMIDRHALFMTEALIRTPIKSELKGQLLESTRTYLEKSQSELCEFLSDSEKILKSCEVKNAKTADMLELKSALEKKKDKTPEDLNELGVFYITLKKDVKKAQKFFLEAIKRDHSGAMYNLALLYETEFKDYDKAKEYYLMAVEKGHSGAMNNLALLYQTEFKDYDKAKEYYLMAVEQGDSDAMYNLGWLYETEFKDYEKAKEYYLMAVEQGDSGAMNNLAVLYKTEFKDYDKAKEYYLMAVEKGHSDAMYNLAWLYQTEFKDYDKAKEYYLMAVEQGDSGAMNNLALLYQTEFKDYDKAKEYYLMAVEKGHSDAMYNLALLYETEFKDYDKAKEYYLMAVEQGDSGAMNNLAWLYFEEKKNKNKAVELSRKAFEKEKIPENAHTHAMILLWDNQIKEAISMSDNFLNDAKFLEEYTQDAVDFMLLLMAKKQYHLALKIFNENAHGLKDRFKPIYYALMSFMKKDFPNEYLKMGGELKETVEEIIAKVNQLEKDYQ